jgi:peptidyl-prolyl cis-trans isomerase SurA
MIKRVLMLAALLLAPALAPAAKMEVIDRIVAVINDSVIMQSELDERVDEVLRNLATEGARRPPLEIIRQQVLERMVEESLQLELAERMGIRVDDTSLNEALTGIARQNNFTLEQFAEEVRSEGMDWASFREQIRNELMINQVRQRQVAQRIRITDLEVDRFLASELGKQLFESEFRLGHILIQLPDGASPQQIAEAQDEADSIIAQLEKGEDFSELAVRHSDDSYALKGGDLGWRPAAQWPALFSEAVVSLQPGELAGPLRSGNGFHILKMIDRRGDAQKIVEQYSTRHILLKPSAIRSSEQSLALARSLRARIEQGESFEVLAKEFSDDPGSARNGGDLGWVSSGEMVDEFEQYMLNTPTGALSPIFETQFGWHFLRVDKTRNMDMSEEFRRLRARQALHQRRYAEELQNWLQEIRSEAYVDIRL